MTISFSQLAFGDTVSHLFAHLLLRTQLLLLPEHPALHHLSCQGTLHCARPSTLHPRPLHLPLHACDLGEGICQEQHLCAISAYQYAIEQFYCMQAINLPVEEREPPWNCGEALLLQSDQSRLLARPWQRSATTAVPSCAKE